MDKEVQIKFGEELVTMVANPSSMFRIVKALQEMGMSVKVRYRDGRRWSRWRTLPA